MSQRSFKRAGISLVVLGLFLSGCNTPLPGVHPGGTSRREVTEEMPGRLMNGLSVKEFLGACGSLAADLSSSDVVQKKQDPPIVIEIGPVVDSTGRQLPSAHEIYHAAMREKLLNMGHCSTVFTDPRVRDDVVGDGAVARAVGDRDRQQQVNARLAELVKPDYWLTGFVYRQDEVNPRNRHVFRYYRVQFSLTDLKTGLIAWEKHYDVKNEGVILR